jgi:mono/diheme cytochrome c family protein
MTKKMKARNILFIMLSFFLFGFIGLQKDIWKAPEEAKKLKNPTVNIESSIQSGKKLYRSRCAVCHGKTGLGDGPGGKALVPQPESLKTPLVQNQTDGEIFWKISNGRNDMIKWEPILTEQQRWDLVNFIRTMK